MTSKALEIWILQTGEPLHVDAGNPRPMRAMNLANTLTARGHHVVLWSTDYDHFAKRFRGLADRSIEIEPKLELRLLPSTGYRRNIGPARLLDHAVLGINLRGRLRRESKKPDVAFVGYPPIETAYEFSGWLEQRGVPFLLDVKDQWPVIFSNALPRGTRSFGRILFAPYYVLARKAMRRATGISAMADGFLGWALDFCNRARNDFDAVFPLTTPTGNIDASEREEAERWWDELNVGRNGQSNICFVGSFSAAFDFGPVSEAARTAREQGDAVRFILCGDGGEIEKVKALMGKIDNVVFPGWIDRPRIEALAARSIATIAPYRNIPDFELSIPNKIIDSLALELPIISPLRGEVAALFENEGVGLRYDDRSADPGADLYRVIQILVGDVARQQEISARARELYASRFSFEQVYGRLADHLERMARQAKAESGRDEDG